MNNIVISCIIGHRYGRHLLAAIFGSKEFESESVVLRHVFCLHPSYANVTGGYELPLTLLRQHSIPFTFFDHVGSADMRKTLSSFAPHYVLVCGLRQIIPARILRLARGADMAPRFSTPSFGFICFHPSDLPDGAGMSPVQHTILEGADSGSVSAFFLDDTELDGGDIIAKSTFRLPPHANAAALDRLIAEHIHDLVKQKIMPAMADQHVAAVAQATFGKSRRWREQLKSKDRWLDFETKDARSLATVVRAFTRPYGGATFITGDRIGRVYKSSVVECNMADVPPGAVLSVQPLIIRCADGGALRVEDVEWLGPADG